MFASTKGWPVTPSFQRLKARSPPIYIYIYIYIYSHTHTCICMCMLGIYSPYNIWKPYMMIPWYSCANVCAYVCVYVCVYTCMHVCMYLMYIYACLDACTHVYAHTHISIIQKLIRERSTYDKTNDLEGLISTHRYKTRSYSDTDRFSKQINTQTRTSPFPVRLRDAANEENIVSMLRAKVAEIVPCLWNSDTWVWSCLL